MKANEEVCQLLAEWRRLTELEGQAVDAEAWEAVAAHQDSKRELRRKLESLAQKRGWDARAAVGQADSKIGDAVASVVTLEAENLTRLRGKKEAKGQELARVNQSVSMLRGVRRAYAGVKSSRWESYS